jgi:hypothetical protein
MIRKLLAIIICILLPFQSIAATVAANSCSLAHVETAIAAASRGDTVTVPDGSCSWATELVINKSITLQGAGIGSTVITSTQAANTCTTSCSYMISYVPTSISDDAATLLRITGFTLDADFKAGHIEIYNNSATPLTMVRIDNNALTDSQYPTSTAQTDRNSVMIRGPVYGVMDNNTLSGAPTIRIYGTGAWMWQNLPWVAGTASTFFVEDNSITYDYPSHTDWVRTLDSTGWGASWVVRYNDYTADPASSAAIMVFDSHPGVDYTTGTGPYATRGKEAYGNDFTGMGRFNPRCNGGQSLVFYNRDNDTDDTYKPSSVSQMDYNNETGLSTCGSNAVPSEVGRASCAAAVGGYTMPQHPHREAEWANWWGATPTQWPGFSSSGAITLRANNDYFNYNTSFGTRESGNSTGVGCGTLAARPATCTTGVYYWATDQSCSSIANFVGKNPTTPISGTLYRCGPTDTWTSYYVPYTYPHPLRASGGSDTTPPTLTTPCAGASSCTKPIVEIPCGVSGLTQDVYIGATSTDSTDTVYYCAAGGSCDADATYDEVVAAGAEMTGNTSNYFWVTPKLTVACGTTHTYYASATDSNGNEMTTPLAIVFTVATGDDETGVVVTNLTDEYQGIRTYQTIEVNTNEAATCRYCIKDVSGCSSATLWASRTAFSTTGGETVHHDASISLEPSSTSYVEVLCQDMQGNESTNLEITIRTDAEKNINFTGDKTMTFTGDKTITFIP